MNLRVSPIMDFLLPQKKKPANLYLLLFRGVLFLASLFCLYTGRWLLPRYPPPITPLEAPFKAGGPYRQFNLCTYNSACLLSRGSSVVEQRTENPCLRQAGLCREFPPPLYE